MKHFKKVLLITVLLLSLLYISFRLVKRVAVNSILIDRVTVEVNGADQNLFIYGSDETNPVLLFVHGGPGLPESPLFLKYNRSLLDNYTLVFWEQRGSGFSYSPDLEIESITGDLIVEDLCEVSRYLTKRFSSEKVGLIGHSWGTIVGVQAVVREPDLFSAYIGISQKSSVAEAEAVIFRKTIALAESDGNRELVQQLREIADSSGSFNYNNKEDRIAVRKASIGYGGGIYGESGYGKYLSPYLFSYEYGSASGMYRLIKGLLLSVDALLDDMNGADLTATVDSVGVPFYIIQGKHDLQTPHEESYRFFEKVRAPEKAFFTLENSAHNPLYEEPQRVGEIIDSLMR